MKIRSENLGSLSVTTVTLVTLLLWLAWGIILDGTDAFYEGFQSMNTVLLREWLLNRRGVLLLKVWVIGLCAIMALLGLNLVFCSWIRFFSILRARFNASKFLMLVVHLLFGFVALGHFAGFMLGYRHEDIRLAEGKVFHTRDGHEIRVETIQWAGDLDASRQPQKNVPIQGKAHGENFAEVSISRKGKELHRDRTYNLTPVRYHDIQVTLKGFVSPAPSTENQKGRNRKPDGLFVVSRNPAIRLFLLLYPLMILGITLYLVMTWRKTPQKNMNLNLPRKESDPDETHNFKTSTFPDSPMPSHLLH